MVIGKYAKYAPWGTFIIKHSYLRCPFTQLAAQQVSVPGGCDALC